MGLLYRRCFLLFLLLTIVEQGRADFYYFLQHSNKSAYRINSLSRNLEKLQKEGSWGVIKAIKFDSLTLLGLPKNIIISQIPSLDSSKVYFIANCTNQFYLFDLKTMLFKRVDKTFYEKEFFTRWVAMDSGAQTTTLFILMKRAKSGRPILPMGHRHLEFMADLSHTYLKEMS